MKNTAELRKLSNAELFNELEQNAKEIFSMRMQKGAGQSIKSHQISAAKKVIARIKTLLSERAGKQE